MLPLRPCPFSCSLHTAIWGPCLNKSSGACSSTKLDEVYCVIGERVQDAPDRRLCRLLRGCDKAVVFEATLMRFYAGGCLRCAHWGKVAAVCVCARVTGARTAYGTVALFPVESCGWPMGCSVCWAPYVLMRCLRRSTFADISFPGGRQYS